MDVELYDGADAYITSSTTDAAGGYSFTGLADGTYKVRVRSATIGDADTPPGGLNATRSRHLALPAARDDLGQRRGRSTAARTPTVDDTATGDNAGPGDT